ncbi:MAG: hypothetical protein BGO29_09380 [Bacteroidales bacterium 36-12]|nr:MAG: hypothetical protein BGO29_09380 [Bacteroidales bacterium 36-12]
MLAPIVLFAYNRLNSLESTINSLLKNKLSQDSELFIFVDGPKNDEDVFNVEKVKEYVKQINGFKNTKCFFSEKNNGLAASIISGVTDIINTYDKVIVIEDDLLLSSNFLNYMNESLCHFKNKKNIFSISGYSVKVNKPIYDESDIFYHRRAHSWGWGTWKDRWETVDWELRDSNEFINNRYIQKKFNKLGDDMSPMLINFINKKINSWYIRFCYEQFKQNKYTVYPYLSKVINQGFIESSTHCNVYNRFRVNFDNTNKVKYIFNNNVNSNYITNKEFLYYFTNKSRIIGKLKTYLLKMNLIKQYNDNL